MNLKQILLCSTFLIALTGCQPGAGTEANSGPIPTSPPKEQLANPVESAIPTQEPPQDNASMTQTAPTFPIGGLEFLVEKAKKDLAQRLSITMMEINLIETTEVVWSNSSLGCPQPDMVYADVLTPGYLILLEVGNINYEYHTSKGTEVIYCKNPAPPVPGIPGDI